MNSARSLFSSDASRHTVPMSVQNSATPMVTKGNALSDIRGPRSPTIEGMFHDCGVFRSPLGDIHGLHPPPMIEGTFSDCGVFRAPLGDIHGSRPPPMTKGTLSVH